jgi:outer membrane murein-binding lipoprotein Lpp
MQGMKNAIILSVLLLTVPALAAVPSAAPTSRPAESPDVAALRRQVNELADQVRKLAAEVARLRQAVDARASANDGPAAPSGDPAVARAVAKGQVVPGMTKAEVDKVTGGDGQMISNDGRTQVWVYAELSAERDWVGDGQEDPKTIDPAHVKLTCTFRGGKLVSVRKAKY